MRHSLLILVTLILAVTPTSSFANTLDPSHRLWSDSSLDAAEWTRALLRLEATRAVPLKWHDEIASRSDAAAVGRRVLVIPVIPADATDLPRTQPELRQLWTADGEASVRGYWNHVSVGQLELEITVLPWLSVPGTLQSDYPNVINGAPASSLIAGPRNLAADALDAAARIVENLHAYDDDGPDGMPGSGDDDGVLDLVVVLHPFPGWEVDPVDVPRAIVSLQTRFDPRVPVAGTSLEADAFMVASASGPLGVWVHEFGHLLGLPDLYDLDRSPLSGTPGGPGPQGGLGRWSLMASGTWGGEGNLPAGLDAWSRFTLGFGEVLTFDREANVGLPWIEADRARSMRLRPLGDWGEETFLVEARHPRAGRVVDGALPGEGALVYRVRPDLTGNSIAAKFVALLQADGRNDLDEGTNDGDASDPYDGSAGRGRLDGTTVPSSESAMPSLSRTAPSFTFSRQPTGMLVDVELAAGPALRLEAFGFVDSFFGVRTYMIPGEQNADLTLRFASAGSTHPGSARLGISLLPGSRPIEFSPAGPYTLERDGSDFILGEAVEVDDPGAAGEPGLARLELSLEIDGSVVRTIEVGLPIAFSDGLPPDALARFTQDLVTAGPDTTRFVRLPSSAMPRPALVGYELQTTGVPGYANSVEVSLLSSWFAMPPDALAWLWARGSTESGIPGQVFDGAALEAYVPDRGWEPLTPEGRSTVYITRRSAATTRDRMGFGGEQPDWAAYSAELPQTELPGRIRIRFASDASIAGGRWEVAGLQTDPHPQAEITLGTSRSGRIVATARLEGDFGRVDAGRYQYRLNPNDDWKAASLPFQLVASELFTVSLDLLPEEVMRAEIGLFSGVRGGDYLIGSAGLRRDPPARLPTVLENPSSGQVVLQSQDRSTPLSLSVYDVRGRRRARLTIPPHTTWFEWVPRADNGAVLSSGKYYLRSDGTESGTVRFTWLR